MQNKLFIALIGTLGLESVLPAVTESLEAGIPGDLPSWFLLFAGIFSLTFIAEKSWNAYLKATKK